ATHTVMSTGRGDTPSCAAAETAIGITISAVAVLLIICPNATVSANSATSSSTTSTVPATSGTPTSANSANPNGAPPASAAASDTMTLTGLPVSSSSD